MENLSLQAYMETGKREINTNGGDFQYLVKCYLFGLGSAC